MKKLSKPIQELAKMADNFLKESKKNNKKWIPNDLKEGRFKGWSLTRMKDRYKVLKNKKEKSKKEISEMRALALGIRFKGGDIPGGKKKKGL